MKRPLSITIIALFFIISGLIAVVSVIADLLHSRLNLNFTVLMLPVGLGLLKGKSSSLGWARFWVGLLTGGFVLMLFLYLFFPHSLSVTGFNQELRGVDRALVGVGLPLLGIILGIWMWKLLHSLKIAPFFQRDHASWSRKDPDYRSPPDYSDQET